MVLIMPKIGRNRPIFKALMEDVVEELKELQKLCQDRERLLGHLDYGPIPSFEKIQSYI